jgi:hypothetical protein
MHSKYHRINEIQIFFLSIRNRLSGTTTKKIRTDHEILTRENEKLVRKLDQVMREQQTQPGGKNGGGGEDDPSGQEVNNFIYKLMIIRLFYFRQIHRIIVELLKVILMILMKKCLY